MRRIKFEDSDPYVLQGHLSSKLSEFTRKQIPIVNINQFYDRIAEKHIAIIFYYE